jgi:metal-responsive CopG/Arc/MetJ family transcriptional regulator
MATIKTDISLSKALLEEVETVASEMKISRSRLFVSVRYRRNESVKFLMASG